VALRISKDSYVDRETKHSTGISDNVDCQPRFPSSAVKEPDTNGPGETISLKKQGVSLARDPLRTGRGPDPNLGGVRHLPPKLNLS
jgi:hypothetical protein